MLENVKEYFHSTLYEDGDDDIQVFCHDGICLILFGVTSLMLWGAFDSFLTEALPVIGIIMTTCLAYSALKLLSDRIYKKARYFWYDIIPVVNIISFSLRIIFYLFALLWECVKGFAKDYDAISDNETNKALESAIKSTEAMTETMSALKISSGEKTDELVLQLMNANIKMKEVLEK